MGLNRLRLEEITHLSEEQKAKYVPEGMPEEEYESLASAT